MPFKIYLYNIPEVSEYGKQAIPLRAVGWRSSTSSTTQRYSPPNRRTTSSVAP